jgi:hypothetical protein
MKHYKVTNYLPVKSLLDDIGKVPSEVASTNTISNWT